MSQACTDIDTSTVEEMDFDSVCQSTRYLINPITGKVVKELPQCGKKAEYIVTYHSVMNCEVRTRLICEPCFQFFKRKHACKVCDALIVINYHTIGM